MVLTCYFIAKKDPDTDHKRIYAIIGIPQWRHYIFFCFGVFVKKYFKQFVTITNNAQVMAAVIVSFFLLLFFEQFIINQIPVFYTISFFLYGFLGITTIYTVFRKNEEWFATNQNISRWMQYIGRHTLDIYLLHYFFLPRNLQMIGEFFKSYPNPTIELIVSSTLALIVIGICLLVSKVLCTSPILANVLFGKK